MYDADLHNQPIYVNDASTLVNNIKNNPRAYTSPSTSRKKPLGFF